MMCSEVKDAGELTPAKDDNKTARHFIPKTLSILDYVDYNAVVM